MTLVTGAVASRVCQRTGFALHRAGGELAWRVAKDRYVKRGGINDVAPCERVGPLDNGAPDARSRFDTCGRTVYFASSRVVALAEVLQAFRADRLQLERDAAAIDVDVEQYLAWLKEDAKRGSGAAPGEVGVDWQMQRSLYRVTMPTEGWWVSVTSPPTLNGLSEMFQQMITIGDVTGPDRGLTTAIAQRVRDSILDDGSQPLGIRFMSKTGYGHCWAWWNRRADDGLSRGSNEPVWDEEFTVGVPEMYTLGREWGLTFASPHE